MQASMRVCVNDIDIMRLYGSVHKCMRVWENVADESSVAGFITNTRLWMLKYKASKLLINKVSSLEIIRR